MKLLVLYSQSGKQFDIYPKAIFKLAEPHYYRAHFDYIGCDMQRRKIRLERSAGLAAVQIEIELPWCVEGDEALCLFKQLRVAVAAAGSGDGGGGGGVAKQNTPKP